MDRNFEKSLDGVLVNALSHCARYRLSRHDLSNMPKKRRLELTSRWLDALENELETITSGEGGGAPGGGSSAAGDHGCLRKRVRGRSPSEWRRDFRR